MLDRFRMFWTKVIAPSPTSDAARRVSGRRHDRRHGRCRRGALGVLPRGQLWQGVVVITVFVFSDLIDGYMARTLGVSSLWGSFLDSTLDRLADAAIFAGLAIWLFEGGDDTVLGCVTLWALSWVS